MTAMRVLLLLTCLLLPVLVCAQNEGELLKNPGFDLDENKDGIPDGWSTNDKTTRRQEVQAFSGNYELVSLPGTYVLATQDVTLKPGQQYNLTMRIRGEGGAMGGALVLHGPTAPTREFSIVWNLEVGDKYENYVASFKAPDAACCLYIYNVARQGTIYYDSVSLREGSPDQLIVQQLSLPKIDRPIEEPPVTEHIPYGRNLAGGPLKTFIALRSFRHMREVVELAQRLDLDYDVLNAGTDGDEAVSETGRRMMQRLGDGFYEVYLVSSKLSPAATQDHQGTRRAGRGAGGAGGIWASGQVHGHQATGRRAAGPSGVAQRAAGPHAAGDHDLDAGGAARQGPRRADELPLRCLPRLGSAADRPELRGLARAAVRLLGGLAVVARQGDGVGGAGRVAGEAGQRTGRLSLASGSCASTGRTCACRRGPSPRTPRAICR